MPRKLPAAKRDEYRIEVWRLSGQGLYNTEIAERIGIHRHTVAKMLEDEKQRRRELMPDEDMASIRAYEAIFRESWRRINALPIETNAQNAVGYLNASIGARKAIDEITGVKAPAKNESTLDVIVNMERRQNIRESLDEIAAQRRKHLA